MNEHKSLPPLPPSAATPTTSPAVDATPTTSPAVDAGGTEKVNRVKEALYKLFGEYEHNGATSSSFHHSSSRQGPSLSHSQAHAMASKASSSSMTSIFEEYHQEMRQMTSSEGKSQLDIYLEEGCTVGSDIDVLEYWKMNKNRFPQLAILACDILSIPITTVASESSFSIGGRILHKYRNCLLPENVQALICTRSWLHGFKEDEPSDAQDLEVIQLSKEDSNVVLDEE